MYARSMQIFIAEGASSLKSGELSVHKHGSTNYILTIKKCGIYLAA